MTQLRIRRLVALASSFVALAVPFGPSGCGGGESARRSVAETTAATVPNAPTPSPGEASEARDELMRPERARDEARRQAAAGLAQQESLRREEQRDQQERAAFETGARRQLDEIEEELRRLKYKAAGGSAEARAEVDELSTKRHDVERLFRRLNAQTDDTWEQLKSDLATAIEDLKKSIDDARTW